MSIVVAVVTAVAAVVVVEQVLALEGEGNGFVQLLVEVEPEVVHQVADCRRIDKIVCHLGAVGRN